MKKIIQVKTDDPKKKKFNLVVTGPVEKVANIKPSSVYLRGNTGETLEAVVTITPSQKFKFSILGMEQKINTGIKTELVEPKSNEASWQVKIKVVSDKPGDLYDVITLKTDSPYRPKLTIRVYANFNKKQESKS